MVYYNKIEILGGFMIDKLEKDLEITKEKLKEFRKENKNIISFSMLNTIETCFRQYKFQYVDKVKTDSENIYTYLGTLAHSLIEKLYTNEITKEQAIEEWNNKIEDNPYYFLDYTRAEKPEVYDDMFRKNELYKNNYNTNMIHFFENFMKSDYVGFFQEKRVLFELGKLFKSEMFNDYIFSGIVDFIGINNDGTIDIIDYKTSTMYKNEKLELHSYQLILYALALEKMGYKINKIGWNFLKYVRKIKKFKNGNIRTTNIERKDFIEDDNLDFEDCMVYVDYTIENKKKALKYVYDNILNMFKINRFKEFDTNKIPYNYNQFFCENLCSFYSLCNLR